MECINNQDIERVEDDFKTSGESLGLLAYNVKDVLVHRGSIPQIV